MEEIQEEEEGYLMIGQDLNVRTDNKGDPIGTRWKKEEDIRRSTDKMINREGRIMINRDKRRDKIKERGQTILNGSYEKKGEWTLKNQDHQLQTML